MAVSINGTSGVSGVDGSAGTPALQGSDTNTGISFGTDEVAINTAGTERTKVDSSGRLLVGTSSARSPLSHTPSIQVEGVGYAPSTVSIVGNDASGNGAYFFICKSRGTSVGSNTIVQNGDEIGSLDFLGADGTQLLRTARIQSFVDGTPGTNDMPGRLVFSTTADGSSSPTERMRIRQDGAVLWYNLPFIAPSTDNAVAAGGASNRFSAIWAANGTIQTSDQRAKTDVADATLGSDFIKSLRPVSYKWIEGGKVDTSERDENNDYIYESIPGERTHWGFIAQEVKQAVDAAGVDFGGWVLTDKDDPNSQQALRYDQFIAPLTKALQEALEKIETLEAKVAALEGGAS